ncbi:Hypothetical predicted protein, partial [Podarcis lilfordi]
MEEHMSGRSSYSISHSHLLLAQLNKNKKASCVREVPLERFPLKTTMKKETQGH